MRIISLEFFALIYNIILKHTVKIKRFERILRFNTYISRFFGINCDIAIKENSMNLLWTLIMLASVGAMIFINPDEAVGAMTAGANNAVTLALSLLASYALWLGLFNLIEKTGISSLLSKILRKPVNFLFPDSNEQAKKYMTMNISANFLGLGNAATPMGINAVCAMYEGNETATTDMIMMLVISSTSLQLLPGTVIGLRAAHGSSAPVSFLPACLLATVLSTFIGITLVKLVSFAEKKLKSGSGKPRRKSRSKEQKA